MLLGIALEELAGCPFNCQKMHTRGCFTHLERLHDVGMFDPLAVARLSNKARNSCLVLAKLLAEDFHGYDTVCGVVSAEDGRGSTLPYFSAKGVSGEGSPNEILFRHDANLTS